jgi:OmpA-OmpF porin, OOP family
MKKFLAIVLTSFLGLGAFAQFNKDFVKRPTISIGFTLQDFTTAESIKQSGLGNTLSGSDWKKTRNMSPGIAIGYHKGLFNNLDYTFRLAGAFLNYPNAVVNPLLSSSQDRLLLEADASAQLKLLSDKYWISPYINAGIGASKWKSSYGAFVPLGVGLQINIYDESFIFINNQYRQSITENTSNHMWYSLGIAGNIGKPKVPVLPIPKEMPVVDKDTDGDGVLDSKDECVTIPGVAKNNGCPPKDSDGDGINDDDDKCPNERGIVKYNGCPIPDKDGDGINDEEDKCVDVKGLARLNGCPIPDTDGDGINDEEDKCPTVAGIAENSGCPKIDETVIKKIEYAAKNIYFETGKSKILAKSYKSLNDVVAIMKQDETLKLDIGGHTDNTGKPEKNVTLSESRAAAVLAYLTSKGIAAERLTSAGYGSETPVADNNTAAGRQANRRVELKVSNF